MFGDLSLSQRQRGISVSGNEADSLCFICGHRLRLTKKYSNLMKKNVWDWKNWRVFLRGNQILKSKTGYYTEFSTVFFCPCCHERDKNGDWVDKVILKIRTLE